MRVLRGHTSIVPIASSRVQRRGLRPFDPGRDLAGVADLIEVAFGVHLDPLGRYALAEMRRAARYGWLLWGIVHPFKNILRPAPGFVWVEDGQIVGNVSLRRAYGWGGILIGNIAVHPDCQGRGIGTALMERAVAEVSVLRGRWAGLEVRSDNDTARRLYERFGFRAVAEKICLLRPAGATQEPVSQKRCSVRTGRSEDGRAILGLVRATVPDVQRPLLEFRDSDYVLGWERALDCWIEGKREFWWVAESQGVISGALRIVHERSQRPDRMEFVAHPQYRGRVEQDLIHCGLECLHGAPSKPVEVCLVNASQATEAAFEQSGFCRFQILVQMRLGLEHRIAAGRR